MSLAERKKTVADRSDLSLRVIANTEKGEESVSRATVKALVEALQRAGRTLEPADFSVNPAVLARRFLKNYACYQAECV